MGVRAFTTGSPTPRRSSRKWWLVLAVGAAVAGRAGALHGQTSPPSRGPDVVRPTVQVRNGDGRGSGTVIASAPNRTWVLTAAHVVKGATALKVELHRHNLGLPSTGLTEGGGWPRLVPATVAAVDPAADVAVLLIKGMTALPYSSRFDPGATEPARGETFTSVGIDRTLFLTRWSTKVEGWAVMDIGQVQGGARRRFTVTARFPEHGRSGGGLFRTDGAVVGVCCGQLSLKPGQPKVGVFASVDSIRRVIYENHLERSLGLPPRQAPGNSGLSTPEVSGKEGPGRNQ
jgi:S1-C subfamily serine protease